MGYRSTFISEHYGPELPVWFYEKWKQHIHKPDGTLISSRWEFKIYDDEIFKDYQKALIESGLIVTNSRTIVLVVLSESGGISSVAITADSIKYFVHRQDEDSETDFILTGY